MVVLKCKFAMQHLQLSKGGSLFNKGFYSFLKGEPNVKIGPVLEGKAYKKILMGKYHSKITDLFNTTQLYMNRLHF